MWDYTRLGLGLVKGVGMGGDGKKEQIATIDGLGGGCSETCHTYVYLPFCVSSFSFDAVCSGLDLPGSRSRR